MSMPQTFSPTVMMAPANAAPMAKPSQLTLATSVEPNAPVNIGTFSGMPATFVDTSAFSKRAMSLLGSMPSAPNKDAWMLKSLQSRRKSLRAPAVLAPNWTGSG